MPYDPTLPAQGSPLASAVVRSQLQGLKALIAATPAGPQGPQGEQGPAGEVTSAALAMSISGTSSDSNAVTMIDTPLVNP